MHQPIRIAAAVAVLIALAAPSVRADWKQFRGPGGSGVSDAKDVPVEWTAKKNMAWKVDMPGAGSSGVVIAGDKLFVTCYSGYGAGGDGSLSDLRRHVVCVDKTEGKILWDESIRSDHREEEYRGIGIPNHGYASATPAVDDSSVFAFFGTAGVVAYDLDGKKLWQKDVAENPRTHGFGSASSPVLFEDLVIVPASVECEEIVAFDKKSGEEKWRSTAEGYGQWWGTPILVDVEDRQELVVSLPGELWGLNPANGKLRWYAEVFDARNICTSPVAADGVVYAIGGRQGGSSAVKLGGKGEITDSHVVWNGRSGAYVPSPVAVGGHLYWVTDRGGIAHCVDTKTGDIVYQQRLDGRPDVYASVVAADGKLYAVTRRSGTFVMAAKPEFEVLSHNTIEGDDSDFNASPAVENGRIYLRSDEALYAIGETEKN